MNAFLRALQDSVAKDWAICVSCVQRSFVKDETLCIVEGPMTHMLIREYYACFNEHRFRDAADLFALDAVLEHQPFGPATRGGGGYLQFAQMWTDAFPDGTLTIDHVEQRGDTICEVDLVAMGTHAGDIDMGPFGVFKPPARERRSVVGSCSKSAPARLPIPVCPSMCTS